MSILFRYGLDTSARREARASSAGPGRLVMMRPLTQIAVAAGASVSIELASGIGRSAARLSAIATETAEAIGPALLLPVLWIGTVIERAGECHEAFAHQL